MTRGFLARGYHYDTKWAICSLVSASFFVQNGIYCAAQIVHLCQMSGDFAFNFEKYAVDLISYPNASE